MTRRHAYPRAALLADGLRALAGLASCAAPLVVVHPAPIVAWALAGGAALFLIYFVRTVVRHLTRIEIDATGISARGPAGSAIRWEDLRGVRLNYYSTRSDRSGGWMQLDVRGMRGTIRIDSAIEGFAALVAAVIAEARQRGCTLDATTLENLDALGAAPDAQGR